MAAATGDASTKNVNPSSARRSQTALRNRIAAQERSKQERDGLIMDTNKSSIVSKRSVEKLYYAGEPEYFRHFVSKFKRRSPLINRGYWLRMKAIEYGVANFLTDKAAKKKIVVNLGCGYDPLPFMFLGKRADLCADTIFVDVDYPALMNTKIGVVENTEQIRELIPGFTSTKNEIGLLGSGENYAIVACDLINTQPLHDVLQTHFHADDSDVAFLFVSEVSTAYMERTASQAVFHWTASYPNARVVLLEQHVPDGVDHPFAQTMMSHFEKLRTPLRAVGTMDQMRHRFVSAGYPDVGTAIRSLWDLWSDPAFLSDAQRRDLDRVEPFDEWEEFALYGSHYFLLTADKIPSPHPSSGSSSAESATSAPTTQVPPPALPQPPPSLSVISTHESPLRAHELPEPHSPRRFAALIPSPALTSSSSPGTSAESLGLHAGMGARERMSDCQTYACADDAAKISPPPLRVGVMCHTITRLGSTADCLLVGGRTAPDKALAECWVRRQGKWERAQGLPAGRFRHAAVAVTIPEGEGMGGGVLVFGGKRGDGKVLDEWLLWTGEQGWRVVEVVGEGPVARFGAAIITDGVEGSSGVLVGGMTDAGVVLNEFWHWELMADLTIKCHNVTARATALLGSDACVLGRFGAQLVRSNRGTLMVGGITGGRMLTRQDEILNMKTLRPQPLQGPRPLLVGCSIQDVDGGLIVLGGGATCFSFGTTWNRSCILNDAPAENLDIEWQLIATESVGQPPPEEEPPHVNGHVPRGIPEPAQIRKIRLSPDVNFSQYVEARQPVVLTHCDIGPCTVKWDLEYLKETIGANRMVSVHVATSEKMDFQTKNFTYATQKFGEFVNGVAHGEKLYLRSLSRDSPSDKPTKLTEDFPDIAGDFKLPTELASIERDAHSSPLRISGAVQMWLHYDVMANVLCQVRGDKRVILFPPSDVARLGFEPGASSSSLDVFGNNSERHDSRLSETHPLETVMQPGDILLIPPMWLHTTAPTEKTSIAVNVFFKDLQDGYAAGRDVYGNRDLAAYEKGRKDVARILKSFDDLPDDVSGFYLERLALEMLDKARFLSRNGDATPSG